MNPSEAVITLLGRGMTEAAIGDAVGVSQGTINKIKRGDMIPTWPTGQKLILLASADQPAANDDSVEAA